MKMRGGLDRALPQLNIPYKLLLMVKAAAFKPYKTMMVIKEDAG